MAASEKTYRSRPIDPPTYEDTTPEARNITHNKEWNYSLFDCCSPGSLCFLTCCLPCLTFGRTQARAQDPTLRSYSSINSECLIFTGLTLCWSQWIIQTIRRSEMPEKHGIHVLAAETAAPHFGAAAVPWSRRRRRWSCAQDQS